MEMSFELATSMIRHDAEEKGVKLGEKRGEKKGILGIAKTMLQEGFNLEDIMKATKLPQKEIESLEQELSKS